MPNNSTSLSKLLEQQLGVMNASGYEETKFLTTGYPPLNKVLSGKYQGGVAESRLIEIAGGPSTGKTALATYIMAEAQRKGGVAIFMDHERSFDIRYGKRIGLSDESDVWVYQRPRTFEDSTDLASKMFPIIRENIGEEPPIVVVFDSLASMIPAKKMDTEAADFTMHDQLALSKLTSNSFASIAQHVAENNVTCIFINQLRQKIGVMYGPQTSTPGGNTPGFTYSQRIHLRSKTITLSGAGSDKSAPFGGQIVTCKIVKNKTWRPFLEAQWKFKFREDGSGFIDVYDGVIDELVTTGVLERAGAYIVWTDGKKYHKVSLLTKIYTEGLGEELLSLCKD